MTTTLILQDGSDFAFEIDSHVMMNVVDVRSIHS